MTVEVKIENGKYILLINGKENTFEELREWVKAKMTKTRQYK
jgi:hypothetical protein